MCVAVSFLLQIANKRSDTLIDTLKKITIKKAFKIKGSEITLGAVRSQVQILLPR